jgi:hypothetical protein
MRSLAGALVLGLGLVLGGPTHAEGVALPVAPPGSPWAACSAPHACIGPVYVRRVSVVHWHRRIATHRHFHDVRRAHRRVVRTRHVKLVRRVSVSHYRIAYRPPLEYIYDPRLAAAVAWADVVNSQY